MSAEKSEAFTFLYSPLAVFFFNEKPEVDASKRCFWKTKAFAEDDDKWDVYHRGIAYGVAVRLKEMEDSGMMDDILSRQAEQRKLEPRVSTPSVNTRPSAPQTEPSVATSKPSYNILSCERESGSDFSYKFVLELTGDGGKSLKTFRAVQQEFRQAVKEDYLESFPSVDPRTLFVDFTEYRMNEGKIEGRAEVLTISVVSLKYDPNTRTGTLAVKVNANQFEEARKWIRKNIETLARDKNIALTTGEIPPAAKFYLGREEIKDGKVLEIEFRTE